MVLPVSAGNLYYSPVKKAACILVTVAPSVICSLLRPQVSHIAHLNTGKKTFAYFFLGAFVPTVVSLRWHNVAWKTSFLLSLGLTIGAKYIDNKFNSCNVDHSQKKSGASGDSKKDLAIDEPPGSLRPVVLFKNHAINEVQSPLGSLALSTAASLQRLIPGDYTVTENENAIYIDDEGVAAAFKRWSGKQACQSLTHQDVEGLKKHIRYRDLTADEQTNVRKLIYNSIFPLVDKGDVTLPFKYYSGEEICLRQENAELSISLGSTEVLLKNDGEICINYYGGKSHYLKSTQILENGSEVVYNMNPPEHLKDSEIHVSKVSGDGKFEVEYIHEKVRYLTINGGTIRVFHGAELREDSLYLPWVGQSHLSPEANEKVCYISMKRIDIGGAVLELLNFKLNDIVDYLGNDINEQAKKAFEACCNILKSVQDSSCSSVDYECQGLVPNLNAQDSEKTSHIIGPIWSPVAAFADSYFNWNITKDRQAGEVSLNVQKLSCGRGMIGGSAQRTVIITMGRQPGTLTVEINKSNTNDISSDKSSSKYILKKTSEGNVGVTCDGVELRDCSWLFGMSYGQEQRQQSDEEIVEDMDYVMQVFCTLRDIQSSPDTVVFDENTKTVYDFQGNQVPIERIKQIAKYEQGTHGGPLVHCLNDSVYWDWVKILQ